MNWIVQYKPAAEGRLAELWTNSPDRSAIAAAADQIDDLLEHDPYSVGESRAGGNRVLIIEPLAINYKVSEVDRTVFVSDVWRWGRPPKGRRWIDVWRKDSLPGTGPAHEPLGTLHYNLQGAISVLPSTLKGVAGAFQGAWSEAGTFDNMEQAFELVKAWLLDRKEVDDLPGRSVRRCGI